jgi:ABC-type Co2+ transport system permease subunit
MLDTQSLVKYLLEGVAVAAAAFYLTKKKSDPQEILMIAVVAAASFLILDQFAPAVASGARQGSGFGIGHNLVGGGDHDEDDE